VYDLNPARAQTAPFLLVANFTSPASLYWDTISFNPNTSGARFVKGAGTSWSIAPLVKGAPIGPRRAFGGTRGFVATLGPYGGGTFNNHDGFKFADRLYRIQVSNLRTDALRLGASQPAIRLEDAEAAIDRSPQWLRLRDHTRPAHQGRTNHRFYRERGCS